MHVNRDLGGQVENQNTDKCTNRYAEFRRHEDRHAITRLSPGLLQLTRVEVTIAPHQEGESTRRS